MELYEGGRIVGRTPLENYQKPLSPWHLGVATQRVIVTAWMPFQDYVPKEATVSPAGAVFPPDLIELMKLVLNDVTALLPDAKRTSTIKVEIASKILACAAKGERDPIAMKAAALLIVVQCTRYSHDSSPDRPAA